MKHSKVYIVYSYFDTDCADLIMCGQFALYAYATGGTSCLCSPCISLTLLLIDLILLLEWIIMRNA